MISIAPVEIALRSWAVGLNADAYSCVYERVKNGRIEVIADPGKVDASGMSPAVDALNPSAAVSGRSNV
jgi:hypothetical protein